jgi:competence transcription factor ComK
VEVGLIINEKKTKYLKCTKKDTRPENLYINNLHIEQVQQNKYLGSIINDSNSIEEEQGKDSYWY